MEFPEKTTVLLQPVEEQRLPVTNPDSTLQVFGSADGWLSFKDDGGAEFFLVPAQVYEKQGRIVRRKDVAKTWHHLGDYFLVEA
jgi:hypothetical protein